VKVFGLLWADGRGARSVKEQKLLLTENGVSPDDMCYDEGLPEARSDAPTRIVAPYLHPLAVPVPGARPDAKPYPHFLTRRFARHVGEGGELFIVETGKTYSGVVGLDELVNDWTHENRLRYTDPGRKRAKAPKPQAPKWYRDLSPTEKGKARKLYEERPTGWSVEKMAKVYGASVAGIHRAARFLGWRNQTQGSDHAD
jgi:hypothetical protein